MSKGYQGLSRENNWPPPNWASNFPSAYEQGLEEGKQAEYNRLKGMPSVADDEEINRLAQTLLVDPTLEEGSTPYNASGVRMKRRRKSRKRRRTKRSNKPTKKSRRRRRKTRRNKY